MANIAQLHLGIIDHTKTYITDTNNTTRDDVLNQFYCSLLTQVLQYKFSQTPSHVIASNENTANQINAIKRIFEEHMEILRSIGPAGEQSFEELLLVSKAFTVTPHDIMQAQLDAALVTFMEHINLPSLSIILASTHIKNISSYQKAKIIRKWMDSYDGKMHLNNITKIILNKKKIYIIPPEIGKFVNLEILELADNFISSLPDELFDLVKLKKIRLSNNNLSKLSDKIGQLINLKALYLSDNNITFLPITIGYLKSLIDLWIDDNNIEYLPLELQNLWQLEEFSIQNNCLTVIPEQLINFLSGIYCLIIQGNPFIDEESLLTHINTNRITRIS
jgi:Leucine-rich repeat (LRR) protein